ncbi:hypothetical protein [Ramlibacter sp.]|uniref:hypothetical protein n=1 Tax=Ramlibacter sp. TaxID=1917967 RepID=UPI0035B2DA14
MPARQIVLRLAFAAALLLGAWHFFGPFGIVFSAALVAVMVARPLIELAAGGARSTKAMALRDVEGVHYAWHGLPVGVWEDDEGHRWLHLAAVRKAVPGLPRDAVLARLRPDALATVTGAKGTCVRADELLALLAESSHAETVKFKNWVHRDVYLPSAAARKAGHRPTSLAGDGIAR